MSALITLFIGWHVGLSHVRHTPLPMSMLKEAVVNAVFWAGVAGLMELHRIGQKQLATGMGGMLMPFGMQKLAAQALSEFTVTTIAALSLAAIVLAFVFRRYVINGRS
ncbi:hypothetical protein ACLB1G_00015 [Oxalobacteraceae bacterium A2-2]